MGKIIKEESTLPNKNESFDAVVIGAGAGGICAAARLAKAGLSDLPHLAIPIIRQEVRLLG